MKNVQFCSSSRKAKILTGGIQLSILRIAPKLHCVPKFEPDAEIGQKGAFFKGLIRSVVLRSFGRVAQLGEHRPYKPRVTGSSPVPPTIKFIKILAGITINTY